MRLVVMGSGIVGGALLSLGLLGCPVASSDDCAALGNCTEGSGGTTTSGSSTGSTTTTTVPTECSEVKQGDPLPGTCGTFVAPVDKGGSDESGNGTQDKPFATVTKAQADGKPVFVCAGAIEDSVTVTTSLDVFGGFACESWVKNGEKPTLMAPPDKVAVTVEGGAFFAAHDIAFVAATAVTKGTSSVSLWVGENAEVTLTDVTLVAGDGADGPDGTKPVDVGLNQEGQSGGAGDPGTLGCSIDGDTINGGKGGTGMCGSENVSGGTGGQGTTGDGLDGSKGKPNGGAAGTGAIVNGAGCSAGGSGAPGMNGESGVGGTLAGTLSSNSIQLESGASGGTGTNGNGGGGGGGAKICSGKAGSSGGGGGGGGCGGAGGPGGGGGGFSVGIAAYKAKTLMLTNVDITTGKGGNGGKGADGQDGGFAGDPGLSGGSGACAGGQGGYGGNGGPGGGGTGGSSVGVVWSGLAPMGEFTHKPGDFGQGGLGGTNNTASNAGLGVNGLAQESAEL